MNSTQEQLDAIICKKDKILVSAGAGSGKTSVLVKRIEELVCNAKISQIDKVAVVTFTNAAATEMRKRIYRTLAKRAKDKPDCQYIRRNLILFNKAKISTIHSLCFDIIRQYFHLIGIDPNIKITNTQQLIVLQHQALDETLESYYNEHYIDGLHPRLQDLADTFGDKHFDSSFRKAILNIHRVSQSVLNPHSWLESNVAQNYERLSNPYLKFFVQYAEHQIGHAQIILERAIQLAKKYNLKSYIMALKDDYDIVSNIMNQISKEHNLESLYDFFNFKYTSLKKELADYPEIKQEIKGLRDVSKAIIDELKEVVDSFHFMKKNDFLKNNQEIIKLCCEIVLKYDEIFKSKKHEKNLIDYNDFEQYCIKILYDDPVTLSFSSAAHEISSQLDEVIVDEYQDVNILQEMILKAISCNSRRFLVGDVKQSIYGFRLARPDIFLAAYRNFSQSEAATAIDLSHNFRSRPLVINAINYIFSQIMTNYSASIDYIGSGTMAAALSPSDSTLDTRTIVHFVEREATVNLDESEEELTKAEIEAKIVTKYISELFQNNFKINDGDKSRYIRYSDIAILLRSKKEFQIFSKALNQANIPNTAEIDSDPFSATEVTTMLSILKIIDNPHQDIPMLSALCSHIAAFTPDELIEVRRSLASNIYESLISISNYDHPLANKARKFLKSFERWRGLAQELPITQLIATLLEDTAYFPIVLGQEGEKIRKSNIDLFYSQAVAYEREGARSLLGFIQYMESMSLAGNIKEDSALTNDDSVRIMTIHKSKGLQFPVVFCPLLGKLFNLDQLRQPLLIHSDLGISLSSPIPDLNLVPPSFERFCIKKALQQEAVAEEMRILYVAMTRAQERLYLISSVKDLRSKANKYSAPRFNLRDAKSFQDWIIFALNDKIVNYLDSNIDNDPTWSIRYSDIIPEAKKMDKSAEKPIASNIIQKSHLYPKIKSRLDFRYKHQREIEIPSKLSVTEFERMYFKEILGNFPNYVKEPKISLNAPNFIEDTSKAANIGIIYHKILELLNFNIETKAELDDFLNKLTSTSILRPKDLELIHHTPLLNLLNSPLAARIRAAKAIHRELPFVVAIEEEVLLQGVIDCVVEEPDGRLLLIDFKTSKISDPATQAQEFLPQIFLYNRALTGILGRPADEAGIYFLYAGWFEIKDFKGVKL